MKLTMTLVVCLATALTSLAGPRQDGAMSARDMDAILFHGFFSAEREVANAHWYKLTRAEHNVLIKRVSLCMADPHKEMMMMKSAPTPAQIHEHLMAGLTADEQFIFDRIMRNMNIAEQCVGMRIMMNACMYGVGHGK